MNSEIMSKVWNFLSQNPDIRFCQALFILGITESTDVLDSNNRTTLKDNFYDTDEQVLKRIEENNG